MEVLKNAKLLQLGCRVAQMRVQPLLALSVLFDAFEFVAVIKLPILNFSLVLQ